MTDKVPTMMVPEFKIHRIGDVKRLRTASFSGGEVGMELGDLRVLGLDTRRARITLSGALVDQRTFYEIGMMLEMGEKPQLPAEALEVGRRFYESCQHTETRMDADNFTRDICVYTDKDVEGETSRSYRFATWFVRPEFTTDHEDFDECEPIKGTYTRVVRLPPSGWVVMTDNGMYDPETGTPFETTEKKEDAIASMVSGGISEQFALKNVSSFHPLPECFSGKTYVLRGYPFNVVASFEPFGGYAHNSHFPIIYRT